ncbi:MAG: glycosyltransferase family 4 protein [Bacteroidia bacterium]|nr:glycosyltransferase family 4 protein [Bacteroidia bacterium]
MLRKILYIAHHRPGRSPGQRFRFEQYIRFLEKNNFQITYSYILSEHDDEIFYSNGRYFAKFLIFCKSIAFRIFDAIRAHKFDIVIIYREGFMLGTILFEWLISLSRAKIVFDFDDAIWIPDISEGNEPLKWLKRPSKTAAIIKLSDIVMAGNEYLARYALQFNRAVKIVPTVIDIEYHKKNNSPRQNNVITIGWTGSSTTLKHFLTIIPALKKIKQKYEHKVKFKVIVDCDFEDKKLGIVADRWNKATEIKELSEIDIGIMPLPDNQWTKGKCGFKVLQYMALGIPAVVSPVGVNNEIITQGQNGFFASSEHDWVEKISFLVESEELRQKLGKGGYDTVVTKYSINVNKEIFLDILNNLF